MIPPKIDGEPRSYTYILDFNAYNTDDVRAILIDGDITVDVHPKDSRIEVVTSDMPIGYVDNPGLAKMLSDFIRRGEPYFAVLRYPGNKIVLAFYRDRRKGQEQREQTVSALTRYKSSETQDSISCLSKGDELKLESDYDNNGNEFVTVESDVGIIGRLPKKIAERVSYNQPYGVFFEKYEEIETDDFETIYKPYIRIYW